ncbi:hypothetical protein MD484_g1416, partial [Candolleomyces efflorescens]
MSARTRSVAPRATTTVLSARSADSENSPPPLRVSSGSRKTLPKSTSTNAKPSLNAAPRRPSRPTTALTSATQTAGSSATSRRKSAPAAILGGSSLSNQQKKVGRSFSGNPILKQGGGGKGTQIAEEFDSEGNKENIPPFRLVSLGSPSASARRTTGARFYSSTYSIRTSAPDTVKEKLVIQVAAPVHIIKLPRGEDRDRHEEKDALEKKPSEEKEPLMPAKASEGLLKVTVQTCEESDDSSEDSDSDSASEGADVVEVSDSSEDSESDDGRDDYSD